ncbi:hypothetical protein C8R45DRAFT_575705 [Mycena sanguinolenta]|nr:hypothetical protein C8R45DRAFT_575705 [Mycena sanguinolenta]
MPPIPRIAASPVPPLAPPPVPPAAAPPDPSPSTRFAQLTLRSPHPGPPPHGSSSSSWFSVGGDGDAAGGGGGEDGEMLEDGQGVRRLGAALGRRDSGKEVAKEEDVGTKIHDDSTVDAPADRAVSAAAAALDVDAGAEEAVAARSSEVEVEVEVEVATADSAGHSDVHTQDVAVDEDHPVSAASPSPAPAPERSPSPVAQAVPLTSRTPPLWVDDGTLRPPWLHEDPDYRPSPASPSPAPASEADAEEGELVMPLVVDRASPPWTEPSWGSPVVPNAPLQQQCSPTGWTPPPSPPASLLPDDAPPPAPTPRDPTPPPPPRDLTPPPAPAPAVTRLSVKEWNQRRKLEREVEERERERVREQEREREREREKERERERDLAQGEDKENEEVSPSGEDGLNRILDGIRRSANEKAPPVSVPVQPDVEMCDAAPLVVPTPSMEEPQPRDKLSMAAFATTGDAHLLSPLTVASVVDSRTPSPNQVNGVKGEAPPLVVDEPTLAIAVATAVPPSPSPPSAPPPPPSVLHSPKAPRFPSPAFTSNGVARPLPPHLQLSRAELPAIFHSHPDSPPRGPSQRFPAYEAAVARGAPPLCSPPRAPSPEPPATSSTVFHPSKALRLPAGLTSSGNAHSFRPNVRLTRERYPSGPSQSTPSPSRIPSPTQSRFPVRSPSQEEGEILPGSSSPPAWRSRVNSYSTPASTSAPRTSYFAQHSPTPSHPAPPTQPRSHRAPPSAPKALREASAQNPNAVALGAGGGGPGRAPRFNGMGPQTIPANVLDPSRSKRGSWKKRR